MFEFSLGPINFGVPLALVKRGGYNGWLLLALVFCVWEIYRGKVVRLCSFL